MLACTRYLEARRAVLAKRPDRYARSEATLWHELINYGQSFGRVDDWAGRIPEGPYQEARVRSLFNGGAGSLRELMNHLFKFNAVVLGRDLVGPDSLEEATIDLILTEARFDVEAVHSTIYQAKVHHGTRVGVVPVEKQPRRAIDPNDWYKCYWLDALKIQLQMRVFLDTSELDGWSRVTRQEFVAMGGVLSPLECELCSPLGHEYVPWQDGSRKLTVDRSHEWAAKAARCGWDIRTGVSGMSAQYHCWSLLCNEVDDVGCRVACLGYLVPTRAHSFAEVATAFATISPKLPFSLDSDHEAVLTMEWVLTEAGREPRGPSPSQTAQLRAQSRET